MTKRAFMIFTCLLLITIAGCAQNNYTEVSLPQLMKKKQQGDGNMIIVDVRTNGEFYDSTSRGRQSNIGHIKDAIHIELRDLQNNPGAIKQLEPYKDRDIYLICSHSYRSRSASNILLQNGFPHVNNVRGGMTEWFRRYDELAPYRDAFYQTTVSYKNLSASQLAKDLIAGKKVLLLGISSEPKYFWDSATVVFYKYFPVFKDAIYFSDRDSMGVLQAAQKEKGAQVVLFNMVNNGAAELADWLVQKGIPDVSYLVGGNYYFYEYIRNNNLAAKISRFLKYSNTINFITPRDYCEKSLEKGNMQLIDLRHDTLFNKKTNGIKYDYHYVKGSINFFSERGENAFMQQFPGKQKEYVLMSSNGITGLELADALTKQGYTIYWIAGGLQRLEWYTINMENFKCADILTL